MQDRTMFHSSAAHTGWDYTKLYQTETKSQELCVSHKDGPK